MRKKYCKKSDEYCSVLFVRKKVFLISINPLILKKANGKLAVYTCFGGATITFKPTILVNENKVYTDVFLCGGCDSNRGHCQ